MIVVTPLGEKQVVYRLGDKLEEIVRQITLVALENNGFNITKTARTLGLGRSALSMRLKKYGEDVGYEPKRRTEEMEDTTPDSGTHL